MLLCAFLLPLTCFAALTKQTRAAVNCSQVRCGANSPVCRLVVKKGGNYGAECLKQSQIPKNARSKKCGSSGLPLLRVKGKGRKKRYKLFKNNTCPSEDFVQVIRVCCYDTDKPGQCPATPGEPTFPLCTGDNHCRGRKKCCPIAGGDRICREPVPSCAQKPCKKGQKCVQAMCPTPPCPPKPPVCVQNAFADKCLLPKEVGPCRALIDRYYYDRSTGQCTKFHYGGCQGNNNNFKTKAECLRRCSHHICLLPNVTPNVCLTPSVSYYFDVHSLRCRPTSGCASNDNHFSTKKDCNDLCGSKFSCPRSLGDECSFVADSCSVKVEPWCSVGESCCSTDCGRRCVSPVQK